MISIIIPTYNEEHNIANCLISIQNQNYDDYEIIVVDNNSTDKTIEIVKLFRKVRLYNQTKIQSAGASKNFGAGVSLGGILVFIDADEVIGDDFLMNLTLPIQMGIAKATAPYTINNEGKKAPFHKGTFRAITMKEFLRVGGFDVSRGYADDIVDDVDVKQVDVILHQIQEDTLKKEYLKGKWVGNSFHYTGRRTLLGKFLYRIGFFKGLTERRYLK